MRLFKWTGPAVMSGFFYGWVLVFSSAVMAGIHVTQKPELVLLNSYEKGQKVTGWLMSEKLDGVRAYWDGRKLISRSGRVFAAPGWFVKGFPPFELDGELWMGRGRFSETVSVVNRKSPHNGWQRLTYQVFEVPDQPGGLIKRLSVLKNYLKKKEAPFLKVIPQKAIQSQAEVKQRLTKVVAEGGEGLVLRDPKVLYHSGRSLSALKVKKKQDAECQVAGYTEGKGKYQGKVGALVCKLVAGQFQHLKKQSRRLIKIGSGLSDAERAAPPKIGAVVTFQYMGLTSSGLPRFPVFLRVREDYGY